jgi:hypothetical protein
VAVKRKKMDEVDECNVRCGLGGRYGQEKKKNRDALFSYIVHGVHFVHKVHCLLFLFSSGLLIFSLFSSPFQTI